MQKAVHGSQHVLNLSSGIRSDQSRPAGFFPLDIGNRWTYSGETSFMSDWGEPFTIHFEEEHTIIGTEELFDRTYLVEKKEYVDDFDPDTITYWIRYRQDRAGLYEADVSMIDPPGDDGACAARTAALVDRRKEQWDIFCQRVSSGFRSDDLIAFRRASKNLYEKLRMIDALLGRRQGIVSDLSGPPGGVLPEEITRLRYPLHPRQEWIIRESPLFESVVIRHEVLDLPAGRMNGFEISISSVLDDPRDVVLLWYGRKGLLKTFFHIEAEMVNPNGDPVGTLISEQEMILESLEL